MFAPTTEIADKNQKTIRDLCTRADLKQAPDLDSLPSFDMERTQFLDQWNKIYSRKLSFLNQEREQVYQMV